MSKPHTDRTPTFFGLESTICNLVCLASMTADHVQNAFEGDGARTFAESEVNTLLYSVFELRRQIEAFKVDYYAAWQAEAAARKAAGAKPTGYADNAMAMHGPVRTAWRTAMSEAVPNLSFREMSLAHDILNFIGSSLRDVCEGSLNGTPGGNLIEAIQEDVASVRSSIGDYCINVTRDCPSDDPEDQQSLCDSVALNEAAFDPEGYADEIAAIGARLVKKNRKAEAKRKAATVTAKAA